MNVKMNKKSQQGLSLPAYILYKLNYNKYSISFHRKAIFLCQFIIRKYIFNKQISDTTEQSQKDEADKYQ